MQTINLSFILLLISTFLLIFILNFILRKKPLTQLQISFSSVLFCALILDIGVLVQNVCYKYFQMDPSPFENFIYIGTCFLPVCLFFTALIFNKTKIYFKKSYLSLFIIPILTLIMVWTNNYHHLFYKNYSLNLSEQTYGIYFTVHTIYTYGLLFISMAIILMASKKNSGFFSKQSLLILVGISIPLLVNLLGYLGIIDITVFVTPISFTVGILFFAISILKFNFLSIAPIAIQKIVNRISDSYIVLNDDGTITDFNQTFLTSFHIKTSKDLRGQNFESFLKEHDLYLNLKEIKKALPKVKNSEKTVSFDLYIKKIKKHFHIEINSILSEGASLGTLILFKDITQHIEDMQKIKDAQETLMESERLSSLGQLIGGIAHNLKTPIMSISGAAEGLTDLVKEYDSSIDDPEVNSQDHHDIAKDMFSWIEKIKEYTEYMSDIITAVKGQAVTLSETENVSFDLDELVKRVNILMKHELKSAVIYLNIHMNVDSKTTIHGDVNSLVQVINNMISNAIQAYNGKEGENIDLILEKQNNNLIISVKDYGSGLPEKVKNKLFKEMITTKGKNGTGLGLYMSYSTIKAHFNGDITFESEANKGTTFNITLPL